MLLALESRLGANMIGDTLPVAETVKTYTFKQQTFLICSPGLIEHRLGNVFLKQS